MISISALSPILVAAAMSPTQGGCPNDDAFAGNQSCESAPSLPSYGTLLPDMVVFDTSGYADFYRVEVRPGATATFTATFAHSAGDIDMRLYSADSSGVCTSTLADAVTSTDDELITWTNSSSSTVNVILQTYLYGGATCSNYDLFVFNNNCPGDDGFDAAGSNDTCATATPINEAAGNVGALTLTDNSDDHYRFQLLPGDRLDLTTLFEDFRADIDLYLRMEDGGGCGSTLDSSASTTNNEDVSWTNNSSSAVDVIADVTWYASGDGSTCVPYNMNWAIVSGPCSNDASEPDDSPQDASYATLLDPIFERQHTIANGDDDWYRIEPYSDLNVYVRAGFVHAEGDIDIALYRDSDLVNPIATSESTSDQEVIRFQGSLSDTLYLRIYRYSGPGSCNSYNLSLMAGTYATDIGGTFCEGSVNITGWWSDLNVSGSDLIADNDVTLSAGFIPTNTFGYFLNGRAPGFVTPPGANGDVCIAGDGVGRFNRPGEIQASGSNGFLELAIDLTDIPRASGPVSVNPGESWMFQCWYRDGASSNFSDAVVVWFR